MIRVLVVDDSVTIRTLVSALLKEDPEIEVAGVAPDGHVGLAKFGQLRPDVVTLDVEMPTLDGLATLQAIRREDPSAVVIMCSSLTRRGASTTFDALAAGASDYVAKPEGVHAEQALKEFGAELIAKVKAHAKRKLPIVTNATGPVRLATRKAKQKAEIVAVASSTGGPNALAVFIAALPKAFPLPVVLVQHMPPLFTQLLAERLDASCAVNVREGVDGTQLEPGTVYIAPGGHHMETVRDGTAIRLRMHDGPQENCCRPAADVLFRSAAQCFGAGVLGVVLTGMGQDGMLGAQVIHAAGGQVLAQDEATSVVWGMPRAVAEAGLAQAVLPLEELGQEVVRRVQKMVEAAASLTSADFEYIRTLVQRLAAMELEEDKQYLVQARLAPVATNAGCRDLAELARRVRLEESGALTGKIIDALTTNETLFFRDGHPFEALRKTVLPAILEARKDTRKLSVWSAASSTGQEAYSFSMMVKEHFPDLATSWNLEIIGTDISTNALAQAREARYSRIAINRGLPAQLMVRYFRHENDSWTIRDDIRKMVEFRHMNLDGSWPYMPQFDIVFIRNVLIYMSLETRRKILSRIRRQMAPDGYLLLGSTENMLQTPEGFTSEDINGSLFFRPAP